MSEPSTSSPTRKPSTASSTCSEAKKGCQGPIRRLRIRVGKSYETSIYFARAPKPIPEVANAVFVHVCTDCGKSFPTAASFQYHYAKVCCHKIGFTAGSLEGTRCPFCHAPFANEDAMVAHMDVHDREEMPFRCSFCCRCFGDIETRRSHESEIHRPGQSKPKGPPRKRIPVAIPRSPSPPMLQKQPSSTPPSPTNTSS
uniref:C2H2-type domain-containing protein n=1 Tax=Panagrellus redivivus TaxID=6233 RepID=A0A7E4VG09_PANRE